MMPRSGSSPLARGLPRRARAPRRPCGDHPRSRGVYPEQVSYGGLTEGSSPLARGLRGSDREGGWVNVDHPRSRGVYTSEIEGMEWTVGSSPLARGLLGDDRLRTLAQRIIPARAGFT